MYYTIWVQGVTGRLGGVPAIHILNSIIRCGELVGVRSSRILQYILWHVKDRMRSSGDNALLKSARWKHYNENMRVT